MSRSAAFVGALAVLAVGCRRDAAVVAPASGEDRGATADERDPEDLTAALAGSIVDLYGHISLGNTRAYFDILASDQPIVLVGVTSDSVVVGRSPRAATRDRRFLRSFGPTLLAKNLEVRLSQDTSVGWVFDEMSYRVQYLERIASIPIRQTSIWVRDFDRWVEVLEHWSYSMPIEDLKRMGSAGSLPPPARFPAAPPIGAARPILGLVARLHNDDGADRANLLAEGDDLLVLLPGSELHGAEAREAPTLAELFGPGSTVAVRDHRLAMAKNGEVAWLLANLAIRTTVNDEVVELGLRATYVLASGADGWRAAQVHVSAPVTIRELSRRVFGSE
jgi:ketosteroid isomerase-like protein